MVGKLTLGGSLSYEAKIIADSISPDQQRLTTIEATFPRYILSEINTHRVFSRNSASSRAIPTTNRIRAVLDDPVIPLEWGANKPGMQAESLLSAEDASTAEHNWLVSRDLAVLGATALIGISSIKDIELSERVHDLRAHHLGAHFKDTYAGPNVTVHKQVVNRLLEPFLWHTAIISSTEWENFYALRNHEFAQPEIKHTAQLMQASMEESEPEPLGYGEWHQPYILENERQSLPQEILSKLAVARCARVSYETHDTGKIDIDKDIALHDLLASSGHMSPFEHIARPITEEQLTAETSGNFKGWHQYRKDIPHEDNYADAVHSQED